MFTRFHAHDALVHTSGRHKSVEIRLVQHQYLIRMAEESNALFIHVSTCSHPQGWAAAQVNSVQLLFLNVVEIM